MKHLKTKLLTLILLCSLLAGCARAGSVGFFGDSTVSDRDSGFYSDSGSIPNSPDEGNSGSTVTSGQSGEQSTPIDESRIVQGPSSVESLSVDYSKYDLDDSEEPEGLKTVVFNQTTAEISGTGAVFEGGRLTITEEGVYKLSGKLTEGQVVVSVGDTEKVRLILNGVEITNSTDAAILAETGDKLILTLAEGSTNTITDRDTTVRSDTDTRSPAAIYAKISLSINGSGSLNVTSSYNNAIATKKTLKIVSGTLNLTAENVGLKGNNAVSVCGGDLTINAGGDGIKTEEEEDTSKGYVFISGGRITITTASDGINGSLYTYITGGGISITTTGTEVSTDSTSSTGQSAAPGQPGGSFGGKGGSHGGGFGNMGGMNGSSSQAPASKGIKAGSDLQIIGGIIVINSTGHCVHSSGTLTVGGTSNLTLTSSGGKGIQAHGDLTVEGGTIDIKNSTEGIESKTNLTFSGGDVKIYATDDGINLASSTGNFIISGGSLNVVVGQGDTDGIDSNNSLTVTGGILVVKAASSTGVSGAIDAERSVTISGGTVVILGSSSSSIRVSGTLRSVSGNSSLGVGPYSVRDAQGNVVFSFEVTVAAQRFWIGSDLLQSGQTYTLTDASGNVVTTLG
ncbi:MAG: carbohydrate-binding domain-containing protein [Eubacteriales bacterium]